MSCMSAETTWSSSYADPLWRLRQICVLQRSRVLEERRRGKARWPQAGRRDCEPRRFEETLGGAPRSVQVGPEQVESDVGWAMCPGCRFRGVCGDQDRRAMSGHLGEVRGRSEGRRLLNSLVLVDRSSIGGGLYHSHGTGLVLLCRWVVIQFRQ